MNVIVNMDVGADRDIDVDGDVETATPCDVRRCRGDAWQAYSYGDGLSFRVRTNARACITFIATPADDAKHYYFAANL